MGNTNLCPVTQAEFIRNSMADGMSHRKATQMAVRNIMRPLMGSNGKLVAQGCSILIKGKLKGQRAREVKTIKGTILHAGIPAERYMRKAYSTLFTKTGIIGIQVRICLPYDQDGDVGPNKMLDDQIVVL